MASQLKDPRSREPQPRSTRSLGRHLRRDRHRRDSLSRAQGRQSHQFRIRAGLPARGPLRQHRRPQASGAGEGGRRGRRPRRVHHARPRHLPGGRDAQDRSGIPVHGRHDRLDPDVRSSRRRLHRARSRRRHEDARGRRQSLQDAVGDRPREADRPVSVRQGRDGRLRSESHRCASAHAAVLCQRRPAVGARRRLRDRPVARRPVRADEPRDVPGARCRRHGGDEAGGAGLHRRRPAAHPHGLLERLQQHRRPVLGGQRPPSGQARQVRRRPGPRDAQHRFRPRRDLRSRVDGRHRARQRGFRPDLRRVGISAGAVPVRAVLRADDRAGRNGRHRARRPRPRRLHPRRFRCATACTGWPTSTSARRRWKRAP